MKTVFIIPILFLCFAAHGSNIQRIVRGQHQPTPEPQVCTNEFFAFDSTGDWGNSVTGLQAAELSNSTLHHIASVKLHLRGGDGSPTHVSTVSIIDDDGTTVLGTSSGTVTEVSPGYFLYTFSLPITTTVNTSTNFSVRWNNTNGNQWFAFNSATQTYSYFVYTCE